MRVCLADVPAVTPPYDHALASALGRAGADVELLTGRPLHGEAAPGGEHYRATELFAGGGTSAAVRALKLARLPVDMMRLGRHARHADVVHYQWLGLEEVTSRMLPRKRPRVFTAHDIVPREPRRNQAAAFGRIARAMDAVVVHSEHGAERLRTELDVPGERIHVIPHGAFEHLTRVPDPLPLPAELDGSTLPVLLFFGFVSRYKGVDVLLEAFAEVSGAELWIVGVPKIDMGVLRALAARAPGPVRFLPRFVADRELPAIFGRAAAVVLPYREIDQSGVASTALAFGRPLVVTRGGGLSELADHGCALAVPPGDSEALAAALQRVTDDAEKRRELAGAAAQAAATSFGWDSIAQRTLALYGSLQ